MEIYFCPKCDYYLNITKKIKGDGEGSITVAETPEQFIELATSEDTEGEIRVAFKIDKLKNSSEFKALSSGKQKKLLTLFKKTSAKKTGFGVYFTCDNCGYFTSVRPGTILYKESYNKTTKIVLLDDYSLTCEDPTLPRTKDYICQNKECPSHNKKNLATKEAVFFRPNKNEYNLIYVCCMCKKGWRV